MSAEEGRVDVELNRASDEELSFWPPLEAEFCVPPLPLIFRFSILVSSMLEYCSVPIEGTLSRNSIDEPVIFPKLAFAQRPRQTHTLVIVISIGSIERLSTLGTLENAERGFRGVGQLLQGIAGRLASLKSFG